MLTLYVYPSPLGNLILSSTGTRLSGLWFEGQRHAPVLTQGGYRHALLPVFSDTMRWLDTYFNGTDPGFMPDLDLRGTPFRMCVWSILRTIPYGTTMTYGEVARRVAARLGLPGMSAQAVGGAVGHNPIGILIPCHRVTGSDGSLTGYAAGLWRKQRLLQLEHYHQ